MTMPQDFDDRSHWGLAFESRRDRELDCLDLSGKLALLGIVELCMPREGQHGESRPPLLDPRDLVIVLGRGVAAGQSSGLEHVPENCQPLFHGRLIWDQLERLGQEVAAKGAGEHHREDGEVARQDHARYTACRSLR